MNPGFWSVREVGRAKINGQSSTLLLFSTLVMYFVRSDYVIDATLRSTMYFIDRYRYAVTAMSRFDHRNCFHALYNEVIARRMQGHSRRGGQNKRVHET